MIFIYVLVHCAIAFLISYSFDIENIWHKNESPPFLKMPEITDLNENHTQKEMQLYIDCVILPAQEYFSNLCDIRKYQDHKDSDLASLGVPTYFCLFGAFLFFVAQITGNKLVDFFIGLIVMVLSYYIVSAVYKKTKLKLGTYYYSFSNLDIDWIRKRNGDYFFWNEYLSDEQVKNNYIIREHKDYIKWVLTEVRPRYYVRKVLEVLSIISFLCCFLFGA